MKQIEFNDGQLPDLDIIAAALFEDENDPRSNLYKRKLNRPRINWLKICLCVFLPPLLLIALSLFLVHLGVSIYICITASLLILVLYTVLNLKKALICSVRIYQRFAPDSIRKKCRFEPSCSEYMILAVEKYGFFKGVKKGINRLRRCNTNNGGFDYP